MKFPNLERSRLSVRSLFLCLLAVGLIDTLPAQTPAPKTSVQDGPWSSNETWADIPPQDAESVIIETGTTVERNRSLRFAVGVATLAV